MVYRVEVLPESDVSQVDAALSAAVGKDVRAVATQVYLIDASEPLEVARPILQRVLVDAVVQRAEISAASPKSKTPFQQVEVHLKPGVMDPVATTAEAALRENGLAVKQVRTGRGWRLATALTPAEWAKAAAAVANPVIELTFDGPYHPAAFAAAPARDSDLRHVVLTPLDDAGLQKLSREGHLFLNLAEMQAVQKHYRTLGREPTDVELETVAQTWSEHCVHKTLKSAVELTIKDESGKTVEVRSFGNLIKETIFGATQELITSGRAAWCLSVFKDNAGVIAFDETHGVAFKVETHNRPSAIDPYGGSATGIGGCIRDVLGTGLGARPIANTDTFCVAYADHWENGQAGGGEGSRKVLPPGVIHPKRVLRQVVGGVRDYGNRMGIPTLSGGVYFDDRYVANPLVFAGCVGLIAREDIEKAAQPGDAIVLLGGRTGRDGIHGATFSSAELSSGHADEFSHAVQIGNAITEKAMADLLLLATERGLLNAVTDCGAGGLSSAVGEMGEKLGATVELDRVPLKYDGLRYDEIWISEAQERMVLAAGADQATEILALASQYGVEATLIGTFGRDDKDLVLNHHGKEVGRLSVALMHDALPMPRRTAVYQMMPMTGRSVDVPATDTRERLLQTLAHPNVASRHEIIRQYDHEVQGGSVVKPFAGPLQIGPSDAAVILPKPGTRGVAIASGMAPWVADPYEMGLWSIDEAIRNVICVGASFDRISLLDNFCWPSTDTPEGLGSLAATAVACRDAALIYGTPFISGKDSLHNQFTNKQTGEVTRIPNTLLVSSMAIVHDVRKCVTMDLKTPGNQLVLLTPPGTTGTTATRQGDLQQLATVHQAVAELIAGGQVRSAHDVSDGGWLTAAAEMTIAGRLGLMLKYSEQLWTDRRASYLLELTPAVAASLSKWLGDRATVIPVGVVVGAPEVTIVREAKWSLDELTAAFRGGLKL